MSPDCILETRRLTREFSGFVAVKDVDLKVRDGSIHGLIGPNGAGKTTMFNMLTKFLLPSSGSIFYKGSDITGERPARVARRGLVRSFQISSTFPHMTVLENVRIALQRKMGGSFEFWRSERALDHLYEPAMQILASVELADYANLNAVELPYGRKRALELAAVHNGDRIVEVAVGTGLAFVNLVRDNPDGCNLGIDISAGMLGRARTRLQRSGADAYGLCRASALAIPAASASFDVLLNNYMFDLLDQSVWPVVLAEFRRVLRPGGRLVLANMTRGERPGSGVYEHLYRLSPSLIGGCRGVRLSASLADHGFDVRSREYFQQLLFPSEVILATSVG